MNELTLEVHGDTELAVLLEEAHAGGEELVRMTIAPPDYAAMIELRNLVVTRIDGPREGGSMAIHLDFHA